MIEDITVIHQASARQPAGWPKQIACPAWLILIAALLAWPAAADDESREREWRFVRDVLFTALDDSTYDGNRVTRWTQPPVMRVVGGNEDDRAFVERVVDAFNRLLGEYSVRIAGADDVMVDIGLLIAPKAEIPALARRHGMQVTFAKRGAGYTELAIAHDHSIRFAIALIRDELAGAERKATIVHELFHTLGPSGHSDAFADSVVFQSADVASASINPADVDLELLAFLYGHLSPGDDEATARAAFEEHWRKLDTRSRTRRQDQLIR